MCGLALFAFKYPSMLQFDEQHRGAAAGPCASGGVAAGVRSGFQALGGHYLLAVDGTPGSLLRSVCIAIPVA